MFFYSKRLFFLFYQVQTSQGDLSGLVADIVQAGAGSEQLLAPFDCLGAFGIGFCPAATTDEYANCFEVGKTSALMAVTTCSLRCLLSTKTVESVLSSCW
eukprot:m.130744 g.130744  ORF g.130744 m.130744 type:complete len:100 (-) comp15729_c0_seq3:35-334(-)